MTGLMPALKPLLNIHPDTKPTVLATHRLLKKRFHIVVVIVEVGYLSRAPAEEEMLRT